MPVTIKDIARQLGISYATVSRALNDKYGVNPRTRQQVLDAATRLKYRRNDLARGLVRQRTATIGLIVPDISNPFYPEVARGIEQAALQAGYSVFLCNTDWDREREANYVRLLSEKRVEGLIIAPTEQTAEAVDLQLGGEIPVIYVCDTQSKRDSSYVSIDNIQGGYLATEHLIQANYQTIAFFGAVEDRLTSKERCEGYRKAFSEHRLPLDEKLVNFGDYRHHSGHQIISDMISQRTFPRAVFAVNDYFALGVIQAVREKGLRVPQDVAIVGFDDIPFASFPEIQLTTVAQPKYEMGRMAFELLLEKITSPGSPPRHILLEPQLIIRRTSG